MRELLTKLMAARAAVELLEENNSGEDTKKYIMTFETEDEAIVYAQRLVALKAGDVVKLPNEDKSGLRKAIYTGVFNADDGTMSFISWNSENKTFMTSRTSPAFIHLD